MLCSANGTPRNFRRQGQFFGVWKAVKVRDPKSHQAQRPLGRIASRPPAGRQGTPASAGVAISCSFPTTRYWGHLNEVDTPLLEISALGRGQATLARISHQSTVKVRVRRANTSLRSLAVLNGLSSTPARAKYRAPRIGAPSTHFPSLAGEKCGLGFVKVERLRDRMCQSPPEGLAPEFVDWGVD